MQSLSVSKCDVRGRIKVATTVKLYPLNITTNKLVLSPFHVH